MSLHVEPSIMCDMCGKIEHSGALIVIDNHGSIAQWIHIHITEIFPEWYFDKYDTYCSDCK